MLPEVAAAGLLAGSPAGGVLRLLAGSTSTVTLRRFFQQAAQAQHAAQQQRQQLVCGKAMRMLAAHPQQQQQRGWLTRSISSGTTAAASSVLQCSTFSFSWQLLPAVSRALAPLPSSSVGSRCSNSSSVNARASSTSTTTADDAGPAAAEDAPRRRRRGTTESRAALRRTTESRAAIEDVAVMSRSQLLRRNKPWLAEQCWQHGLSHDGLKEDLIQRLLAWQGTEAGQKAAAAAQAAAAAARAAVAAATAAAAAPSNAPPAAAARTAAAPAAAGSGQQVQAKASPAAPNAAAAAAAAAAVTSTAAEQPKLARPAAACVAAIAVPVEEPADDASTATTTTSSSSSSSNPAGPDPAAAAADAQGAQVGWHAPRSAAAAAADSMGLFLGQLQEQPRNAALVAAARNAVEQYTNQFIASAGATQSSTGSSSSGSQSDTQRLVSQLAATVSSHSSPQSLAAIAKACYSREVQNPVLAASLAEAVAAVAAQLGPQEVYGVLRLLVEHLSEAEDPVGLRTMDKGFRVLAEAMIRCSEALEPVQLAEAVELLGVHKYDDAFGLWMIAKEAAARLTEFDPVKEGGSVVQLLNAIAGMCVADDSMSSDVAAAVSARKGEYSAEQLAAIAAALQRMGCTVEL